jgi:hypothetical protein
MRDKQLLQGQNNMFLLKQKFGILPVRATKEPDRELLVLQLWVFTTKLPSLLPWPTRTSPLLLVGVISLAGAPAAAAASRGAFLFLL